MGYNLSSSTEALNFNKSTNSSRDSIATKYGEPYLSKKNATDVVAKQLVSTTTEFNSIQMLLENNKQNITNAESNILKNNNELTILNKELLDIESKILLNNNRLKELENDMSPEAMLEKTKLLRENEQLQLNFNTITNQKKVILDNLTFWNNKLSTLGSEKISLNQNLNNIITKKNQLNTDLDLALKTEDSALKTMSDANPNTIGNDPAVISLLGYKPASVDTALKLQQEAALQQQRKSSAAQSLAIQNNMQYPTPVVADTYLTNVLNQQNTFNNINNSGSLIGKPVVSKLSGENDNYEYGDGPSKGFVRWDAPKSGYGMTGRVDDIIATHIQPKQKHAFMGEFPSGLTHLDWMIKTMDRPKIDVESVEQIRNNVKRNYPVKYNFGDLSITFWDDIYHKTITTIDQYFHGQVWQHQDPKQMGRIMMRDETVIPVFHIYDLVTDNQSENILKYSFYNATLSSYDFDANDTDDEGTHVIQAVFKIEGYSVSVGYGPPTLNQSNNPMWW